MDPQPTNDGNVLTFWEYFRDLFVAENGLDLPLKKAHEEACNTLEAAFLGELPEHVQYILVNMPRRIGKTKILEAWYSWGFSVAPDAQFIHTSYSSNLAERSLDYVGKTMEQPWFAECFGDRVHVAGWRSDHLQTVEGGNLFAVGCGGSLTGKGGGLKRPAGGAIGIDDPAKPDEALSQIEAENTRQWFETTIKGCRNSDRWCPIVVNAQRLGEDDLPGYIEKTYPENTLIVRFPALVDPVTGKPSQNDDAVSAFPETVQSHTMLALRGTRMGRFVLASQYQQEPVALGGNLIPTQEFYRWDPHTPLQFDKTVITIDTALKTKQSSDFSAIALWGRHNRHAYAIDLMHGKWETPDLIANVEIFWKKWTAAGIAIPRPRIIIEEKAAGTPLLQSLRRLGIPAIGIERDVDKVRRVQNILPYIESHLVMIPKDGSVPWVLKFVNECNGFRADGTATHDDMVDTMVDALEELLGKHRSIFEVLTTRK